MKRELLYICTIAQEQSLSKAAQKLYVSQPSLSHCLSNLEEKLGTKLFYRSTKGLSLTYAGEQYYRMALEILEKYNEFENAITEVNELKRGRISFGITRMLATHYLPMVLPAFAQKYPNIELHPYEASSKLLEQALLERKVDFVFMFTLPPSANDQNPVLTTEILQKEYFVLTLHPDSPLKKYAKQKEGYDYPVLEPKYLKDEPFLLVPPEQKSRQLADHVFQKANIQPTVRLTTNSYETARRLCAQGMGVTLMPEQKRPSYDNNYKTNYYQIPEAYEPFWFLSFLTVKDGYVPLAARELMENFREAVNTNTVQRKQK